jgi:hypothetical protein
MKTELRLVCSWAADSPQTATRGFFPVDDFSAVTMRLPEAFLNRPAWGSSLTRTVESTSEVSKPR